MLLVGGGVSKEPSIDLLYYTMYVHVLYHSFFSKEDEPHSQSMYEAGKPEKLSFTLFPQTRNLSHRSFIF